MTNGRTTPVLGSPRRGSDDQNNSDEPDREGNARTSADAIRREEIPSSSTRYSQSLGSHVHGELTEDLETMLTKDCNDLTLRTESIKTNNFILPRSYTSISSTTWTK